MKAKICATVAARTMSELRADRDNAQGADMVELRLDFVDEPDVAGALAGRHLPVVVTCRPKWEGGEFEGSEEERHRLLDEALRLGAEYVDVEWSGHFEGTIRARRGQNIVLSTHDFEATPPDLGDRYRAMRSTGAEVVKIACRASRLMDAALLMDLADADERRVVIAMGAEGVVSRLLPDRFGSCWTYAGDDVAPGQLGLSRMLDEFQLRRVSSTTAIYGVLGKPLAHSLSPTMHNAGFAEAGVDSVYIPLEAADPEDFWQFAARIGLRGASVTAPYKEQVMARLSTPDELSQQVGAVNTLKVDEDEGWKGINTDVPGFLEPLKGRLPLRGARATVLGAGGAARGVAVALAGEGARVSVAARRAEQAAAVAGQVGAMVGPYPPPTGSWDLLVNTTPIGTHPNVADSPMPDGPFDGTLVYDLVYNPPVTRLMADAAAAGCETLGGLPMLVGQAARQFEWWTGVPAPTETFRRAAEARLAVLASAPPAGERT